MKGDSSVKRDFRSSSRPVNKTTILPFVGTVETIDSNFRSSFNQSLLMVDFSRLVDVDLSTWKSDRNGNLQVMCLYRRWGYGPAPLSVGLHAEK